jgi:DNA-binding CsgD family transcriptional regulator
MGKPAVAIDLTDEEQQELGRRRTTHRLARRARIVLLAAEGLENKEICAMLDVDPNTAQEQAGATQP